MRVPAVLDRPVPCGARWPANASVLSAGRQESGGLVAVQDPGQLPNRPTADPQVNVGVAETEITGLVEGGLVVVGQAGHGPIVVVLLHREGHGSPDQPLDPRAGRGRWELKT
jgi:hypothetical protein